MSDMIPEGVNEKGQELSSETLQQAARPKTSRRDLIETAVGFASIPSVWLLSYVLALVINVLWPTMKKNFDLISAVFILLTPNLLIVVLVSAALKRRRRFLKGMLGAYSTNILLACFLGIANCAGMIIGIIFPLLFNSLGYPFWIWVNESPCFW